MHLLRVEIDNFLVIGHAEIDLDDQGVVLVLGDDQDGGKSDSNGVGKSSIFEAVCWCLYGQTYQGLKYDDIVSLTSPGGTRVTVYMKIGVDHIEVTRYRKHKKHQNKIKVVINGKDKTPYRQQDADVYLKSIIPFSMKSFKHVAYFGQGMTERFLALGDTGKKKLLEELLDLEVFSDAEKLVRSKRKKLQSELDVLTGKRQALEEFLESSEAKIEELEKKQEDGLEDIEERSDALKTDFKTLQSEKEKIEKKIDACQTERIGLRDIIDEERETRTELRDRERKLERSLAEVEAERSHQERRIDQFKLLEGKVCPECEQEVDSEHLFGKLSEMQERVVKLERRAWNRESELVGCKMDLKEQDAYVSALEQKLNVNFSEAQKLNDSLNEVAESIFDVKHEIKALKTHEEALRAPLETLQEAVAESESKLDKLAQEEAEIASELPYLDYWERGFSTTGIRSMLLDDVIDYLNARMAYHSNVISDGEIAVSLSPHTSLKSGDLREKMSVVASTGGAGYKAASGGQKRRMDLAIHFALSDLACTVTGHKLNLLVCDEVFDCIDSTGVEAVMEVLEEKAKSASVFVISHNDALKSLVDNVMLVTRNSGVSEVSYL